MIPAYPPPRPKFGLVGGQQKFSDQKQISKSIDDTDDGYDECQTSDESSDRDCNNVVRNVYFET